MSKKKTDTKPSYSVSVVMPSYYTGPVLIRSIMSVIGQRYLREIILVDNGNCDYVRGKIEEYSIKNDKLHVISGQGNIGFSRACNLGAREAKGDYILFLNPDCILPTNLFSKVIKELEKNEEAWVAGCRLISPDGEEQKGNRRNLLTFKSLASEWFGLHKLFSIPRFELRNTSVKENVIFVPAISSAFMMMKRDKFDELGQMDNNYFVNIEDLDMCFQINEMGGKIAFLNKIEVVRYGSSDDVPRLKLNKHRAKGLSYYFKKNFNGAYFPGAITLIFLIIYLRLFFQAVLFFVTKVKRIFKNPFLTKEEINCYKEFINSYVDYEDECKNIPTESKYNISNRSPVLITDTESQTGVCLLRRLLAANVDVVALYKNKHIDIYHPKLLWVKSDIDNKGLDLPKNTSIKTVIYTSSFERLPSYIEKFSSLGTNRMIAFTSITNVQKENIIDKDIDRICNKKNISYTILKTPIVYGLGSNPYFSPINRFIKKFGRFPVNNASFSIYPPIHADDLAISAIKILNFPETFAKSYNLIGNDKELSYYRLIEKLFNSLDKKRRVTNSFTWLWLYRIYTRITSSKDINNDIRKYKEERFKINSEEAKKDFDFYSSNFLDASKKDLGIETT